MFVRTIMYIIFSCILCMLACADDRAANTNDDGYATIRAPEKGRTLDRATEPVYAPVDHRDTRGASQHYEFDSSPVPNPMYRVSICIYFMYVCVYVHTCLYVCVYLHMYVCVYVHMYVCVYVRMYVCMFACMCVYVCRYVCTSVLRTYSMYIQLNLQYVTLQILCTKDTF